MTTETREISILNETRNGSYCSFEKESYKKKLLKDMNEHFSVEMVDIQEQVFLGGKLKGFNGHYKDTSPFFSLYCEYLYTVLSPSITGGALFEFCVLRSIQACFGEAFDYHTQFGEDRKKIDIVLGRKNGKSDIAIEVKRQISNLVGLEEQMTSRRYRSVGIIFAAYHGARDDLQNKKSKQRIYCCHFCVVDEKVYRNMDKREDFTECFRIKKETYSKEDTKQITLMRYQNNFMECVFDEIQHD